jgi:hypothetical protein
MTSRPQFHTPDELWRYSMKTVSLLREYGLVEAADLLESGVRYTTSSGWEWLGELARAARKVRAQYQVPEAAHEALGVIVKTATSRSPYEK